MSRTSLAIKVHFYNEYVEWIYREWCKVLGDRVFLLMDETRGPVEVGGARKIPWSLGDVEKLGLPLIPDGKVAWYNGDYAFYGLRDRLEPDDFCIVVEYDVFVRIEDTKYWLDLFRSLAEYDFVASRLGKRPPHWRWRREAKDIYPEVLGALIVLVGFNKRGLDHLLRCRLELAERFSNQEIGEWPHCEAFVGSALCNTDRIKVGDIATLARLDRDHFRTIPPFLIEDLEHSARKDVLYHPAVNRDGFLRKIRPFIRKNQPNKDVWEAVAPFLSNASEAETRILDAMAVNYWGATSFAKAFTESRKRSSSSA